MYLPLSGCKQELLPDSINNKIIVYKTKNKQKAGLNKGALPVQGEERERGLCVLNVILLWFC